MLTVVLRAATCKTLSAYLEKALWQPMGAEADATWITAPDGLERGAGFFSATLRDWGRLRATPANDGALDGKQIIPRLSPRGDGLAHTRGLAPKESPPANGY